LANAAPIHHSSAPVSVYWLSNVKICVMHPIHLELVPYPGILSEIFSHGTVGYLVFFRYKLVSFECISYPFLYFT